MLTCTDCLFLYWDESDQDGEIVVKYKCGKAITTKKAKRILIDDDYDTITIDTIGVKEYSDRIGKIDRPLWCEGHTPDPE